MIQVGKEAFSYRSSVFFSSTRKLFVVDLHGRNSVGVQLSFMVNFLTEKEKEHDKNQR